MKNQENNNLKEILKESEEVAIAASKVPVKAVKTTIKVEEEGAKLIGKAISYPFKKRRSILHFFWRSKTGIISGAADNDPSGIVTYIQTGAVAGLKLLWLALLAWPLLTAIEEMSARIGVVAKKGINAVIYENYGKPWAYLVMIIILIVNTIGSSSSIVISSTSSLR